MDASDRTDRPGFAARPLVEDADWDGLYEEQLPQIYNYLRYRVGPDVAEDLAAKVFEKAWVHRRRYRRDLAAFGTWLFSIARHEAIDHVRRRRRHTGLEEAAGAVVEGASPEERVAATQDAERLRTLLATLDDRERELIALKYGAGLSNREIADLVRLGESNVGTILHRTIRSLREAWDRGEGHAR